MIIENEEAKEQLKQVVTHFKLTNNFDPFSRCIRCNGLLEPVSKETISNELQENTRQYFDAFWQCNNCKHIYWMGSHHERMLRLIEGIRDELEANNEK